MSDTAPRNPTSAPQRLADALMRSMTGSVAYLRFAGGSTDTAQSEVGIVATSFVNVVLSPVVLRKLRPGWSEGGQSKWEMLVSATSVETQVNAMDLQDAQSLLSTALAVTVAGQDYLIESIGANEAFGQVYMYRLLLREARQQEI